MSEHVFTVREITKPDIELIIQYWLNSDKAYLESMGVDIAKLPGRQQFLAYLNNQMEQPIREKESYCVIWELDSMPIGHSNTRPTTFGKDAFMHLHIWSEQNRARGLGNKFIRLTVPCFFENLGLKVLYCEPYARNPAPNKAIEKAGFEFVQEQTTVPGAFNFEQPTKRWQLTEERYKALYKTGH